MIWHSATANPIRLTIPHGYSTGYATGIDSDGTIIGTVQTETKHSFVGVLWHANGSPQLLPKPPHVAGTPAVIPIAIRDGIVVATATTQSSNGVARMSLLYSVKTGTYTELPYTGESSSWPVVASSGPTTAPPSTSAGDPSAGLLVLAGNAHGWLVGSTNGHPVLYTPNTGDIELPTHLEISTGLYTDKPLVQAISDSGLILTGNDSDTQTVQHTVQWTCHQR